MERSFLGAKRKGPREKGQDSQAKTEQPIDRPTITGQLKIQCRNGNLHMLMINHVPVGLGNPDLQRGKGGCWRWVHRQRP